MNLPIKMSSKIPQNICRICENDDKLINITLTECKWILDKFIDVANVSYDDNDELPKFICEKCSKRLDRSYDFKKQCQRTHKKFLTMLQQQQEPNRSPIPIITTDTDYKPTALKKIKIEIIENVNKNEITENLESQAEIPVDFLLSQSMVELEDAIENSELSHKTSISTTNFIQSKEVKSYFGITTYECYICAMKFTKQIQMEQHMKVIHFFYGTKLKDLLKCKLCNEIFLSSSQLSRHKRKEHLGITFKPKSRTKKQCELCGRIFSSIQAQQRHIKNVHQGEKSFVCQICNKAFTQNSVLKNHVAIVHYKEKDYKCDQCDSGFGSKHQLVSHQIRHMTDEEKMNLPPKQIKGRRTSDYSIQNNQRRAICEICGQSIAANWIDSHMRTHNTTKSHKCDLCDKTFSTKRHMVLHRVMHKDDRPFNCDLCDKTFRRKSNLNQHRKRHSTDKPYKCLDCNKAFAFPLNLRLHERVHTGVKPYTCNLCHEHFSNMQSFQRHENVCQQ